MRPISGDGLAVLQTQRLSSPTQGRTIPGVVGPWVRATLAAHTSLVSFLAENPEATQSGLVKYYQDSRDSNWTNNEHQGAELLSSALLSTWILYRSQNLSPNADLEEALSWFFGSGSLFHSFSWPVRLNDLVSQLEVLPVGAVLDDVLPYLFEAFEQRDVTTNPDLSQPKAGKKVSGIYYTPSDVSEHIVGTVFKEIEIDPSPRCIDPACGTGMLLRAVLDYLMSQRPTDRAVDICESSVFGIDISCTAAQSAAFVLVSRCLIEDGGVSECPHSHWQSIHKNIVVADSTRITRDVREGMLPGAIYLPDLLPASSSGFDAVVGNPPYTKMLVDKFSFMRSRIFRNTPQRQGGATYLIFLELMWKLLKDSGGSAGMVVPLAVAYNSQPDHQRSRHSFGSQRGKWTFEFFDRTPDSLFGDDVKVRNAIVFYRKLTHGEDELRTTSLLRWASGSRHRLFESIRPVTHPTIEMDRVIPKLGTDEEVETYYALRDRGQSLREVFRPGLQSDQGDSVYHYSTSYNWLSVFRKWPIATTQRIERIREPSGRLPVQTASMADFVFALLSSNFCYWLWRVECDGFHLTRSFIDSIPVHPSDFSPAAFGEICGLGAQIWSDSQAKPKTATNGGVVTIGYSPIESPVLLRRLDAVICKDLDIDTEFTNWLLDFRESTIAAGR